MPPEAGGTRNDTLGGFSLEAAGVTFAYDQRVVLHEVSFRLGPGELLAVVGPNGSGKSSLVRLLVGERRPKGGVVRLNGRALAHVARRDIARHLALVPQNTAAPFGYTVREVVLMARYHAHAGLLPTFETATDMDLAHRAMWDLDVHHMADRPVTALSGGERQRVMIARALAQDTPCVLLDEPTSALDLHHQLELVHHLRRLVASGKAVLLVTHDLNLALRESTRTLVLDEGQVVADGPPDAVLIPRVLEPVYRVRVEKRDDLLVFHREPAGSGAESPEALR